MKKFPKFTTIIGILLLLVAIIGAIGFYYARQYAQIGAGMMAKQMCSCLYVQNRQENECLAEMDISIGKFTKYMKIVYFPEKVVVSFSGLAITQAKMSPGYGCSASKFEGQMPNGLNNIVQ